MSLKNSMTQSCFKIPYARQWIDEKDIEAVVKVLQSEFITQGPVLKEFEESLARYCGVKYAVSVNSGTAALHCGMFAIGLSQGDEVIVPPLTFVASANAALYVGAKVVFSDIDPGHLCLDINQIEEKITDKTKAIVMVDFAGYPADARRLRVIAKKYGLKLIEDAAHALGALRDQKHAGFFADCAILSFHPVKHITTGEGGAILTNDEELYQRCLLFRSHGITKAPALLKQNHGGWYYEMHALGHNYRLTDIQAALGISQLSKIEQWINRRRDIARQYIHFLKPLSRYIQLPSYPLEEDIRHAYHLFPVQFVLEHFKVGRKEIYDVYQEEGIGVQVHYIPVHLQPFYVQYFGCQEGNFPITEQFYQRCLSLPLFPQMSEEELKRVFDATEFIIEQYGI